MGLSKGITSALRRANGVSTGNHIDAELAGIRRHGAATQNESANGGDSRRGAALSSCDIWTHPLGGELRCESTARCSAHGPVEKLNDSLGASDEWRKAFEAKGWISMSPVLSGVGSPSSLSNGGGALFSDELATKSTVTSSEQQLEGADRLRGESRGRFMLLAAAIIGLVVPLLAARACCGPQTNLAPCLPILFLCAIAFSACCGGGAAIHGEAPACHRFHRAADTVVASGLGRQSVAIGHELQRRREVQRRRGHGPGRFRKNRQPAERRFPHVR